MKSRLLKAAPGLAAAAIGWYALSAALDNPVSGLRANTLATLHATLAMMLAALLALPLLRPRLRFSAVDLLAAVLFALISVSRFLQAGPAATARYDEILQAAMLYLPLRLLFAAAPHLRMLLATLLCLFGAYEVGLGLMQIYGFAPSNHALFSVTGSFFNPGPYAGFVATAGVCGFALALRLRPLAQRACRMWKRCRRRSSCLLLRGVFPCAVGTLAALSAAVVLPATMSRAAWVAAFVAVGTATVTAFGPKLRARIGNRLRPGRIGLWAGAAALLAAAAVGAYSIKRPSADGRLLIWKIDTRIIRHAPLAGVGLGNFAGAYGREQADYFALAERSEAERRVAGCPEWGFNDYLQLGAETGIGGLLLMLALVGIGAAHAIRRRDPAGYGLLAWGVFAAFSYPWAILSMRLLFAGLTAAVASSSRDHGGSRCNSRIVALLLVGAVACWPSLRERSTARIEATRAWAETRIWLDVGRCDYLVEDGAKYRDPLQGDFRFLYDYGYALHKEGRYAESDAWLERGTRISSDPMFWNIRGKNFQALGAYDRAETCFLRASHTVPDRIYPRYLLARLYRETGNRERLRSAAEAVVRHRVRIESAQTRQMQREMREVLDSLSSL